MQVSVQLAPHQLCCLLLPLYLFDKSEVISVEAACLLQSRSHLFGEISHKEVKQKRRPEMPL